jgi:excisionase family DNA binding protein
MSAIAPHLLSLAEVAQRLGCSTQTVRRRVRAGQLPAIRLGPDWRHPLRVNEAEFEAWLEGHRTTALEAA